MNLGDKAGSRFVMRGEGAPVGGTAQTVPPSTTNYGGANQWLKR